MLTRLKVNGFKNLVDVDVRFGPFTCIAGANGVGKSNLFDAIRFLSSLADRPLVEAALSVRDEGGRTGDVRGIFHHVGDSHDEEMSFEAQMLVPLEGLDDLGQKANASSTFLRYCITLKLVPGDDKGTGVSLKLVREELTHITKGDAPKHLLFPHKAGTWRDSVLHANRRAPYYISTDDSGASRVINLHQDGGSRGQPVPRLAADLPRTVLSAVNAAESPTALLARREMQSWRLLQLEPSALRQPDAFTAPTRLGANGAHLPATLYHLAQCERAARNPEGASASADGRVYAQVGNRLAELLDDVKRVGVDRDERRELLTLQVTAKDGTTHTARGLSDGTLRFLALAVLEVDPQAQGLLCLEEPENGVHPERIPAMLRLLQDIATDTQEPLGPDNPLRQVIVNTHSPAVVGQVPDDSLLVAELKEAVRDGPPFKAAAFSCLAGTWRDQSGLGTPVVAKGKLLSYLNPIAPAAEDEEEAEETPADRTGSGAARRAPRRRRVVDRKDLHPLLFPPSELE